MINMPIRERIGRFKYVKEDEIDSAFDDIIYNLDKDIDDIVKKGDE
jgi:V/A-type H+-transporting ATPase subunit A